MRLAVLSEMGMDPWINLSTFAPALEEGLARFPDVEVVRPPGLRRPGLRSAIPGWSRAVSSVRRADVVFWLQSSARPKLPVWALAYTGRARRSALVIDPWRPSLPKIQAVARTQRLAPCFITFREAYDELSRGGGSPFVWMPFGVDVGAFKDYGLEKDVLAFWMGRRYEPLHEALVDYAARTGLEYRFSRRPGEFPEPEDLGRMASRSRFFLVTPPDLDKASKTGGYSPLVMRYMEGLAAGAQLVGVLPRSGEYENMLPMDAIVQVAPDGTDLAEKLDAALARDDASAVRRAQADVQRLHSWAARAESIHATLVGAHEAAA